MSGGRLQVQVFGAGAIVPSLRILDSVDRGVLEAGFAWPQFWAGKHPATALFSNSPVWPMAGLDAMSHFAWMYEQGGYEMYHELLQKVIGVDVVSVFVTPSGWQPLGWFKVPIKDIAQFRKLKYRGPPGLAGEIFKEAGIAIVSMPGEEIIPAAERGVLDGAEWINPVEDVPFGFPQVFKHYHLASIHQFVDVGEIVINGKFWSKLTPEMQEMVRAAGKAAMIETYTADIARNAATVKKLRDGGITIWRTPPDIHAALMQAAQRVLQKHSEKDPFYKKVVDSQVEFARTVQSYWGEVLRMYQNLSNDAVIK
jgi:TRAP-type mannitol/chloroaromatic compound transport system substrate-binding protein